MSHAIQAGVPALILAPMEGVTDAPMREFLTELGGIDFCVTEFLRISQNALNAKVIRKHMPEINRGCRTRSGVPVQLQLLGGNAELLAETATAAVAAGVLSIDLNFGCPAPTVNRHDGGATILKYPERLRSIIEEVKRAVPKNTPVSAKLRLGWESVDDIDHNAVMAVEGGADWITIHGRTRVQGYQPPAWWTKIAETKRRVHPLPVIANGEIWTLDDFKRCRDETKCEHFMIGRSALADPQLSMEIQNELKAQLNCSVQNANYFEQNDLYEKKNWANWLARYSEIAMRDYLSDQAAGSRIKQWLRYAKMKQNLSWFDEVKTLPTSNAIVHSLLKN